MVEREAGREVHRHCRLTRTPLGVGKDDGFHAALSTLLGFSARTSDRLTSFTRPSSGLGKCRSVPSLMSLAILAWLTPSSLWASEAAIRSLGFSVFIYPP